MTNKALSFVLTSEFPWFRLGIGRKGPQFHAAILAENATVAGRVLGRIRERRLDRRPAPNRIGKVGPLALPAFADKG